MPTDKAFQGERITLIEHPQQFVEIQLNSCQGINKFDQLTLDELSQVITRLNSHPAQGVLISSAQKVFFAGGDIEEFVARFKLQHAQIIDALQQFNKVLNRLESLPCPTVAVLNGATLGGGVELALACDYRLALPTIKIGLPEVNLGIIPGTGGTVRLPRLIGAYDAAEWICTGDIRSGEQAYQSGLVDKLLSTEVGATNIGLTTLAELSNTATWQPLRANKRSNSNALSSDQQQQLQQRIQQQFQDQTQTARLTAIDVIAEQCALTFEQALDNEMLQVAKLGCSQESNDLVDAFLNKT